LTETSEAQAGHQPFVLCSPEATIKTVAEAMDLVGAHLAIISEGSRVMGVVSDGDLRRALLAELRIEEPIANVMTRDFVSVTAGRKTEELQRLVRGYKVVPVLSSEFSLVGVATEGGSTLFPVAAPDISPEDVAAVERTLLSGWISSKSAEVGDFEENFSRELDLSPGLAVSNGTAAIELALKALGLGGGDEVLVPVFTFAAVANAVIAAGCVPVFVDIEAQNLGLNPEGLERYLSDRLKAIIVVHSYGAPAEIESISHFATSHNLLLIEDCAEAIGTKVSGRHVGSFGDAATFSFFANKTITTGEGGFVAFASREVRELASKIRDHGMSPGKKYWHDVPGHNFRMTGMQAALGQSQLRRLAALVGARVQNFKLYSERLGMRPEVKFWSGPPNEHHSHWLSEFRLVEPFIHHRDVVIERLGSLGVEARPYFYPMSQMPAFESLKGTHCSFPVADFESARGICLPSSSSLRPSEIDVICERVIVVLDGLQ